MSKQYSRKMRMKKIAATNCAIGIVVFFLVVGIFFAYPVSEGAKVSYFGTQPVIWLQKVLELILQPILIGQLLLLITEDMSVNKKD